MKRTRRGMASAAEEEAEPRRSDGGGMIPPRRQWILQERSQFVEKIGTKRPRKVKGGQVAAEAAAAAPEGVQKLSTR